MATAKPTQKFVPIQEIKDNVLILKDGTMRAIIIASSLNFGLKSAEEQAAILYQFQDMLNSLDFSIQIYVQSRRFDVRPYLALMNERLKAQTSDLMKLQTQEYINFIRKFTDDVNVMSKSFYIVIPYSPNSIGTKSSSGFSLNPFAKKTEKVKIAAFEENRSQLEQRVSVVEQGLSRCGVRVAQLGAEEMVELFYKIFNPGETDKPMQLQQK